MPTLLEVLTRRSIEVDVKYVNRGGNTTVDTDIRPDNWSPWLDFNYATLTRIFWNELASQYRGSPDPRPLEEDLMINNEETLEDFLRRFISPTVNYALEDQAGGCHLGRGSRCAGPEKPDWSVISGLCLDDNGRYANILPGDTKLNKKWWPTMVDEDEYNFDEWQKVVSQVETYMVRHQSRFGFILTDRNLVVLRLTRQFINAGLAQERSQRGTTVAIGHLRHSSNITMASGDGSLYSDSNPFSWEYSNPEYATINGNAHGLGNLTVKLALWFLAMMAKNGDRFIDYSYPALDSWRYAEKGYVHNTSGAAKSKLAKGDVHQEPDPDRARRENDNQQAAVEEVGGPSGTQQTSAPLEGDYDQTSSVGYDDDAPVFSQANSTFGGELDPEYEAVGPEGDGDDWQGEAATAGPASGASEELGQQGADPTLRRSSRGRDKNDNYRRVTIKRHKTGKKKLYFINARGHKVDTSKKEWTRVEGGYEHKGHKFVYFTKGFPE